jgi:hypothetical protein
MLPDFRDKSFFDLGCGFGINSKFCKNIFLQTVSFFTLLVYNIAGGVKNEH